MVSNFSKSQPELLNRTKSNQSGSFSLVFGSGRMQNQILIRVSGRVSVALAPTETIEKTEYL